MSAGLRPLLATLLLGLALGSCATTPGRDAGGATSGPVIDRRSDRDIGDRWSDRDIVHLLSRLTFGPRPDDVARVRKMGVEAYLEAQLAPSRLDDSATDRALDAFPTLAMPLPALLREYPRLDPALRAKLTNGEMSRREAMELAPPEKRPMRIATELGAAKVLRAVESERQLQEVMVDFWFNHFNVFAGKGEVRWSVGAYEREAIRPHALGRFRDLLRATAQHPAMLFYLDNYLNGGPEMAPKPPPLGTPRQSHGAPRPALNENYARELLELHSLGVDGGYTQRDVTEVARAFTGWTIDRVRSDPRFTFRPSMHDPGEKIVLGHRIIAGGGQSDGERVLEILSGHPSTARFVATKLARRFVADDPPPALVLRVAATFTRTDGDIAAMLRTIFTAPELRAAEARGAKVKTPFELVSSAVRALDGHVDARGAAALARAVGEIGQPLYQATPPTGHPDRAEAWVSTGALLARMNFALALSAGRYPGVRIDVAPLLERVTWAGSDGAKPREVLDRLLAVLLHDDVTPETRAILVEQSAAAARGGTAAELNRLAALVIGAPEFQRR
jgi:uncharacterized protein (DUF1800 family)